MEVAELVEGLQMFFGARGIRDWVEVALRDVGVARAMSPSLAESTSIRTGGSGGAGGEDIVELGESDASAWGGGGGGGCRGRCIWLPPDWRLLVLPKPLVLVFTL